METTVDIGRRIVQMFWDPEPTNDMVRDQPVWCLGSSYRLNNNPGQSPGQSPGRSPDHSPGRGPGRGPGRSRSPNSKSDISPSKEPVGSSHNAQTTTTTSTTTRLPETPPESVSTSLDSSLAYEEAPLDGGWPPAFLDDFESRIWMTYRSEFEPIAKSHDPKATAALSFSMRLKSQLSDQNGFSSDSGWGCMIRSGQSLLANAMVYQRLGRGMTSPMPMPMPMLMLMLVTMITDNDTCRLETRHQSQRRKRNPFAICRRSKSPILYT